MLWTGAAAIAIFACAGLAIFILTRASLRTAFDAATYAKAQVVGSFVEIHHEQVTVAELLAQHMPEFERGKRPEYYHVWTEDGRTLAKSKSLGKGDLPSPPPGVMKAPVIQALTLPTGQRGRMVWARLPMTIDEEETNPGPTQYSIVALARDAHVYDEMLESLAWVLLTVTGLATAAMLIISALVIRRGLRPIDHLAHRITRIDAKHLSGRLSLETPPAELSPIVVGLNGLLDRLESAFEREKAFTADAAHELRTPLAGLESALEVCARKARAPEAYSVVVSECLEVVRGMHGMIDNLLMLARADANQVAATLAPTNLDDVLEDAWRRFKKAAEQRELTLDWSVPTDLCVQTDREKLRHVLSNLFENAVRYTNEGGTISVGTETANGSTILRMANTGSRISASDASSVFDRFWRGDRARTEIGVHCGLGLSVCRRMMSVLGGQIRASSTEGGEFVVEISLPVAEVQPSFMVPV
jgi:two-component system OmpR family sensor kinase